jgi:hypothetical protein
VRRLPATPIVTGNGRPRAWSDIHDLLPDGWHVGSLTYDPCGGRWRIVARGPDTTSVQTIVDVNGEDELHALTELVVALRELNRPGRLAELEQRARQAYVAGAEEHSQRAVGRGLTTEAFERVRRRFPTRQ